MICNKNMLKILEDMNLRETIKDEYYKIVRMNVGKDNALFMWKTSNEEHPVKHFKLDVTQQYLSKIQKFINGPSGLFTTYEWYANELYVKSENGDMMEVLKKVISIYCSWKEQMVTKFNDIPFDIWLSLEYHSEIKEYIALLRFNVVHADTHYVRPDIKVLNLFKNKAVMMENINYDLCDDKSNNKRVYSSIVEHREELIQLLQKSNSEKEGYLKKYVGYVTGGYPAMINGICHCMWASENISTFYNQNILPIIQDECDLEDDMDYRNLLMMLVVCDSPRLKEFINIGLDSSNEEIIEIATEFDAMSNEAITHLAWYHNCIEEYNVFCNQYRLKEDWNCFE